MAIVYPLLERAVYHLTHDVTIMLVFLLVLLCAYIAQKVFMEWWNLPPGPWGYPFFGILPMVGKEFHLFLYDLIKEYAGEDGMCSLKMGSQTVVVLSDWKVIKEAFGSTDFMARPKTELSSLLNGYGKN